MRKLRESLVSHDDDYHTAYRTSLINCISACEREANCTAAYHVNGFCFTIYKDARLITFVGSSYFEKVCNFTYPSLSVSLSTTPAFGTISSKAFLTAIITSEVPLEFIIWQRVGTDNRTTPLDLTTEKCTQIGNIEQVSMTITINNLTLADSGTYMVYVKSSAGTTNTSNQVIVSVVEVLCTPGTYFSNSSSCDLCPVNTFKSQSGNFPCSPCENGTVTQTTGSTSLEFCQNKQGSEKPDLIPTVTGGVVSVIVVTIVVVIVITVWKRRQRKEKEATAYVENFHFEKCKDSDQTYSTLDHGKQKVERKPVPLDLFVHHVTELMSDNKYLLLDEYEELQQRSTEDATTTVAAMTKKNAL
ncbi:uncharacterized protein LOC144622054 [Crassostrea virginica]